MNPTVILSHTVNLVLQCIVPPSQLNQPIPRHLISKALLQRHYFLQLRPEEPKDYLCWPSPHQEKTICLLESLSGLSDEPIYVTRYTSDAERTYAHVHVKPDDENGLRLVFEWDEVDGWKFHDVTIMPFPSQSYDSLQDALSGLLLQKSEVQSQTKSLNGHSNISGAVDETEDDAYWNAYGQGEDQFESILSETKKDSAKDTTEDAYWAQYAAIQGTADSTVPSPVTETHRRTEPATNFQHSTPDHDSIIFLHSLTHPHDAPSHLHPQLPDSMNERLNSISSHSSRTQSLESSSDSATPPLSSDNSGNDVALDSGGHVDPPQILGSENKHSPCGPQAVGEGDDVDEVALRDSVKAIFHLWKYGRMVRYAANTGTDDPNKPQDDRDTFLRIASEAIGGLY